MNKTFFVFQHRKLKLSASVWNWISWNLTKVQLIQLIQTIVIFSFSIGCLIELKFCEFSRNAFSNKCWKFKLSILKNKKVLFLKKYFSGRCQYQNKKTLFTDPIFSEGFAFAYNFWLYATVWSDPFCISDFVIDFYFLPDFASYFNVH